MLFGIHTLLLLPYLYEYNTVVLTEVGCNFLSRMLCLPVSMQ